MASLSPPSSSNGCIDPQSPPHLKLCLATKNVAQSCQSGGEPASPSHGSQEEFNTIKKIPVIIDPTSKLSLTSMVSKRMNQGCGTHRPIDWPTRAKGDALSSPEYQKLEEQVLYNFTVMIGDKNNKYVAFAKELAEKRTEALAKIQTRRALEKRPASPCVNEPRVRLSAPDSSATALQLNHMTFQIKQYLLLVAAAASDDDKCMDSELLFKTAVAYYANHQCLPSCLNGIFDGSVLVQQVIQFHAGLGPEKKVDDM